MKTDLLAALAKALAMAIDARERDTALHSKRVSLAWQTLILGRRFHAESSLLRQLYWGALLHDIGKIGIPDAILLKHGTLTPVEWQVMREHPEIGHRILGGIPGMEMAAELVLTHGERYDGSGYPRGLKADAIPMWARLFAVIDALDAMTSDRPYRRAVTFDAAKAEIISQSKRQFDPLAVAAFLAEEATLRDVVNGKVPTRPGLSDSGEVRPPGESAL